MNIYVPVVKQFLTTPYRAVHAQLETNQFVQEYETPQALEIPGEEETIDAYSNEGVILTQEDAVTVLNRFLIDHEPQQFGTCVAHSVKNINRFAVKAAFGGLSDFSEYDVYIDRETRATSIDGGMFSSQAIDRAILKGVAIRGVIPTAVTKKDLEVTRAQYPDSLVAPFRVRLIKARGYIRAEGDFEPVWDYIVDTFNKRGVRPFQISIKSMSGWWGNDVPRATGRNLGGHSALGVAIPFMFGDKRAFFCIDSSYRRGTSWRVAPGIRIVTEDCWKGLGRSIRPIGFVDVIEQKLGGVISDIPNPVPVPVHVPTVPTLLTVGAAFGQSNEHVRRMQKALIATGFAIPAISSGSADYGYYGQQTADAVLNFHIQFAPAFTMLDPYWTLERLRNLQGRSFGDLSVKVMNSLPKSA